VARDIGGDIGAARDMHSITGMLVGASAHTEIQLHTLTLHTPTHRAPAPRTRQHTVPPHPAHANTPPPAPCARAPTRAKARAGLLMATATID
jgi:hypothetical protein